MSVVSLAVEYHTVYNLFMFKRIWLAVIFWADVSYIFREMN